MGQLIENSLQASSLGAIKKGWGGVPPKTACSQTRLSNCIGGGGERQWETRGKRGGSVRDFQNGGKMEKQETIIHIHNIA